MENCLSGDGVLKFRYIAAPNMAEQSRKVSRYRWESSGESVLHKGTKTRYSNTVLIDAVSFVTHTPAQCPGRILGHSRSRSSVILNKSGRFHVGTSVLLDPFEVYSIDPSQNDR